MVTGQLSAAGDEAFEHKFVETARQRGQPTKRARDCVDLHLLDYRRL
jgi:hypothetical protein